MRTNHNASGKPSLDGCVGLRYQLRLVLQATYPWVCGILTLKSPFLVLTFTYVNYPHLKKQASEEASLKTQASSPQALSFPAYPGDILCHVCKPRSSTGYSGVPPVKLSCYQKTAFYAIVVIRAGLEYPSTDGLNIFSFKILSPSSRILMAAFLSRGMIFPHTGQT